MKTKPKIEIKNTLEDPAKNLVETIVEQAITNLTNQIITNTLEGAKQTVDGKHFMRRLSK